MISSRPSLSRRSSIERTSNTRRRVLWLIVGILGLGIVVALVGGGGLMALLTILPLFLGEETNAASLLQTTGLAALGIALGIPLAIVSWFGWKERPALSFDPSRFWWGWVALIPAFLFLVALGAAISYLLPPTAAPWILPPIHVVTMCIPPLLILGLVGWGLRGNGGSRREIVAGMASGGCLGMMISFIGEMLVIVAVVVIVLIVIAATPGGLERMRTLSEQMQSLAWQADAANIADVVLSPMLSHPYSVCSAYPCRSSRKLPRRWQAAWSVVGSARTPRVPLCGG